MDNCLSHQSLDSLESLLLVRRGHPASGMNKLDKAFRVFVSSKSYIAVRNLFRDALFDV